ncbi:MAG: hypothetical protein ABL925_09720, partial [Methylococcales bacterium]
YIANAPGGVARLRELVFLLASDGKLLANCELLEAKHLDKVADFMMAQAPAGSDCNSSGNGTIFVKTGEFGELYPVVREWTTKPLKLAKQGDVLIGATVGKLNLAIDYAIGHNIPADDIIRRFPPSLYNLLNLFAPLVDQTRCFINDDDQPELVFRQQGNRREIFHLELFELLQQESLK